MVDPRPERSRHLLTTLVALALARPIADAQSIRTYAGGGSDEGRPPALLALRVPMGLAAAPDGRVVVADSYNHAVRILDLSKGTALRVAGNGTRSYSGDGGPATQAGLNEPEAAASDAAGAVWIADTDNHLVRRVSPGGVIETRTGLVDDRTPGFGGDGGPATRARLNGPTGIAVDGSIAVFIADTENNRIRRIDLATGSIDTVAGTGEAGFGGDGGPATQGRLQRPRAIVLDGKGGLLVADGGNHAIRRIDFATGVLTTIAGRGGQAGSEGDGGPANAALLDSPTGVAVRQDGGVVVSDTGNHRVRLVGSDGLIRALAGTGAQGFGGDGGPATASRFDNPRSVAALLGAVLVADSENSRIRRIDGSGLIETVAGVGTRGLIGDGTLATAAALAFPAQMAFDSSANLVIVDSFNHRIRRIDSRTRIISTIAGSVGAGSSGDSGPATAARLQYPEGVAIEANGDIVVADTGNHRLRRITAATGVISTVAGTGAPGATGDGGPATAASLREPRAMALGPAGDLYFADSGNNALRRVEASTGKIFPVAGTGAAGFGGDGGPATEARLSSPRDLVFDRDGNLLVADAGNNRVRRIDRATGRITTIAGNGARGLGGDGGPATGATFAFPSGVLVLPTGDVLVVDTDNSSLRRIDGTSGVVTAIAGGRTGYSGDGGPATAAGLTAPHSVVRDSSGNLYVSDTQNSRIRIVSGCLPVTPPRLSGPTTGDSPVTLSWSSAPGAFFYDLYLDRAESPANTAATGLVSPSFVAGNLDPGTTYHWKVVAKGDPFCAPISTATSEVGSFTTPNACASPGTFELVSPAVGATGITSDGTLSWTSAPGASRYDLYLGSSSPPPLMAAGVPGTSYTAPGLVAGATYYWSVVAHATCDPTKTTSVPARSFTVAGGCAGPGAFSPQSPSDGATGVSSTLTISWSPSGGATSYDLYLGPSSNPPLYLSDLPTGSVAVTGLASGPYYWKVVAKTACNPNLTATFPLQSFSVAPVVAGACDADPQAPEILFAPASVGLGKTYVIAWKPSPGLDAGGGYVVERSRSSAFSPLLDTQMTATTSASFTSSDSGQVFHRVRAVAGCQPFRTSPNSASSLVSVVAASPAVVFTVQPVPLVTALGEKLEEQKSTFTLENITKDPVQVIVSQAQLGSVPFFQIVDPLGGDTAFVTLTPSTPRTFAIRYSGPPADKAGTYQGLVVVASTGTALSVTPYAFINLKVGGSQTATPSFALNGNPIEYTFFRGLTGDDSNRPPITVDIQNPGTTPMELGGEVGPELWLEPERGWNAQPIPPGASRTVRLTTKRVRAPNDSALPRYTYFTVRTKSGQSARLLVQDNDSAVLAQGRTTALAPGDRSYIVPSVVNATSQILNTFVTKLRLSNAGSEDVQADLLYTPRDADGFGGEVRRATVKIPRNDVVTLTDPLAQLYGLPPPASGQLEVRAAPERIGFLTVTSSVEAPARTGGSFGFQMPTANRGEGARLSSPHVIPGITYTTRFRTNLILAETTGLDHTAVRVVLYDQDGNRKGDALVDVPRYGQKQIGVTSLGATEGLEAGQIELTVEDGSGAAVGLVTVIDNGNDDSVTYVGRPAAGVTGTSPPTFLSRMMRKPAWIKATGSKSYVIPAVVNGYATFRASDLPYTFQSYLCLSSQTKSPATFRLTYVDKNTNQSLERTVTAPGRGTVAFPNALEELFGIPHGQKSQGPIFVEADSNGTMLCKVYSIVQDGRTLGDSFPVVPVPSDALTGISSAAPLYVDGLEQSVDPSRGTRSNLILNEVTGTAATTVVVRLYEAGNRTSPIAEREIAVNAGDKVQLSDVFAALDLDSDQRRKDRTNVQCVVTAMSGTGLVSAVVTTIDNKTGDTKNALLTPAGGVGATGGGVGIGR